MGMYVVTADTVSKLHPRAAAKLGFATLVPGEIHQIDDDVAAQFCDRVDEVPAGMKVDAKSGELVECTRKIERPGFLKKITKAKAKAAREAAEDKAAEDAVEPGED